MSAVAAGCELSPKGLGWCDGKSRVHRCNHLVAGLSRPKMNCSVSAVISAMRREGWSVKTFGLSSFQIRLSLGPELSFAGGQAARARSRED